MKAIVTKYHGPTGMRGTRISASDGDGNRVSLPRQYQYGPEKAHRNAAVALCKKMEWTGCERLVGGGTKDGYAFVFLPDHCKCSGALEGARRRRR